jgi:hypothetical protein
MKTEKPQSKRCKPRCYIGDLEQFDAELVCEKCGAAYGLEYLGMYPEGSSYAEDRLDEGFEPEGWKAD